MQAFHTRTLAELSRLPGVLVAGAVVWVPLGGELTMGPFQVEGGRPRGFIVDKPCISPGYFRAMGIQLLLAREFPERDTATAPGLVFVAQPAAPAPRPCASHLAK